MLNTAEFLRQVLGLKDSALLAEAETVCRIKTVRKDEYLIEQGQLQEEVFLLVDGICRGFFVNERGQDITDCLVTRCGMPLMASGDISIPAPIAIQALTNSQVFCMPTAELCRLIDKYPALLALYCRFVQVSAEYHRQMKVLVYQYSALQRYRWFLQEYPGILDRVSHRHIASFLNMTPVTLSRLVNRPEEENGGPEEFHLYGEA